ncbi:phage head closure protein [Chelatococcus sp. GCM10030263]|uniref:phage head closure protein n=1 Tax=Chelatococcus sp. GCM10030263 TaxID=3273387 RepID=UPI003618F068
MAAGDLRERFAFDEREETTDDVGNTVGSWVERFVTAARVRPLKGGEAVMADRLQGRQPVVITIRYFQAAAAVTPAWRARDARSGRLYNITAVANMDEHRRYLDLLATTGEADG